MCSDGTPVMAVAPGPPSRLDCGNEMPASATTIAPRTAYTDAGNQVAVGHLRIGRQSVDFPLVPPPPN